MASTEFGPNTAAFEMDRFFRLPIGWPSIVGQLLSVTALTILGTGEIFARLHEGNRELGSLLQFAAAVLIAAPMVALVFRSAVDPTAEAFGDQLVAIAVLGALAMGEYATAVIVPIIMNLGHLIEQRSVQGSRDAIEGLKRLTIRTATLVINGRESVVDAEDVRIGDIASVKPGGVLPADGMVCWGESSLDESSITGESVPRDVTPGDRVYAGSINLAGPLHIAVEKIGAETSLGAIAACLHGALGSKAPIVRLLERYAGLYVPIVALLAAFVYFVSRDLQRTIAVFVVSCPCALVLGGPAAMIAAIASATRRGILIKNSAFLEALADADTVVFDKTGTLTEGRLTVCGILPREGFEQANLLLTASICAAHSTHPVACAIVAAQAEPKQVVPVAAAGSIRELAGCGIEASQGDDIILLGKPRWLEECGVDVPQVPSHVGPVVALARNKTFCGFILLADRVRPEAAAAVRELRSMGIERTVLITGDQQPSAAAVAGALGMDAVFADVLPQDKLTLVQTERQNRRTTIVVGDGINDALALAGGDVGIAMGGRGADIAIQSADVVLMSNDLNKIADAIRLAIRTRRIIGQNIAIALTGSIAMLTLSSVGAVNAVAGAFLHNIGTILVLVNAARLLPAYHPEISPAAHSQGIESAFSVEGSVP